MKRSVRVSILIVLSSISLNIKSQTLAPGTVIFSEDFNGGPPLTWSVVNNNANNFQWIWETSYRQGMFSNCENNIASTSSDNGFMLLPMDFYNTPIPASGAINMDTYLETPSITVPSNVAIVFRFQQFVRFCCNNSNRLEVQYSFDNFVTSTSVSAVNPGTINVLSQNVEEVNVPIVTLGNTIKFRILAEGSSHYFWMIDDVEVVIPYTSAVSAEKMAIENVNFTSLPSSKTAIPRSFVEPIISNLKIQNRGSTNQTNVKVRSTLYLDSNLNGSTVNAIVSTDSILTPFLSVDSSWTLSLTNQNVPNSYGYYRLKNEVVLNGVNQLSNRKQKEVQFAVTDSVLAKNINIQDCAEEVTMYGFANGTLSKFGTVYTMGSKAGKLTSISAYIGASIYNAGINLRAELWSYDPTQSAPDQKIGVLLDQSGMVTINASHLSKWHVFPLSNKINLQPDSSYLVVIYQVSKSVNTSDYSTPVYYNNDKVNNQVYESYRYLSALGSWQAVTTNFYFNMNFGDIQVGVEEVEETSLQVDVFPNPSLKIFKIKASGKIKSVRVLDVKGKLLKEVFQSGAESVNLQDYDRGVYFALIELQTGAVISKKLIKY